MDVTGEKHTGVMNTPAEVRASSRILRPLARNLGKVTARLAFCATGALVGAGGGGLYAFETPTQVQLMPGVEASAQPVLGGSEVSFGPAIEFPDVNELPPAILASAIPPKDADKPLGNLDMPGVHASLKGLGEVGVHINISGKDINVAQLNGNALGTLIADPVDTLEKPVVSTLENRLEKDALGGGLIGGAGFFGGLILWEYLGYRLKSSGDNQKPKSLPKKTQFGLAVILLADAGMSYGLLENSRVSVPTSNIPIIQEVSQQVPALNGASINSRSALAELNGLLGQAIKEQRNIGDFYDNVNENFINAFNEWAKDPANKAVLNNSNLQLVLGMGGTHCSYYNETQIAPTIMGLLKARLVFRTGNVGVSASSLPFQEECASFAEQGLKSAEQISGLSITEALAPGNHDSANVENALKNASLPGNNKSNPAFIVLNGKIYSVDGITFGGSATPRENDYGQVTKVDGKPASQKQQEEALYSAGKPLTATCEAEYKSKGIRPIIITNSPEQGFGSAYNGCASFILAGEGPAGVNNYTPRRNQYYVLPNVFRSVQISAGGNGADCNFWPAETIDQAGEQFGIYMVSRLDNSVVYYSNVMIGQNGKVNIAPFSQAKKAPLKTGDIQYFMAQQGAVGQSNNPNNDNPNAC